MVGKGDFEKQTKQAYANIARLLKRFGATLDDLVSETIYYTDLATQGDEMVKIHKELFRRNPPPTATGVEISRLYFTDSDFEQLIEISGIALVPKTKRRM